MRAIRHRTATLCILASLIAATPAAADCSNTGSFATWLSGFEKDAIAQGISRRVVAEALDGLTFDPRVIKFDRRQGVFSQTFLEFSGRMVSGYRLKIGARKLKQYADVFRRVEQKYGVPGEVITAFWALETDFGANMGNFSTLRSLATLAYDCRRPEVFRPQLMDALRVVERGDLPVSEMVGAWAGEVGQTQFLPKSILLYAVDGDGNGRIDLNTKADALASTANFLRGHGWQPGAGYQPGQPNFAAIQGWNAAGVYEQAIAIIGRQIDGG